jgi:hypothetical protein
VLDRIRHHRQHVEGEICAIAGMLKGDEGPGRGGGLDGAAQNLFLKTRFCRRLGGVQISADAARVNGTAGRRTQ